MDMIGTRSTVFLGFSAVVSGGMIHAPRNTAGQASGPFSLGHARHRVLKS
jgi:hypothetical protein